jgi:hypothetical protein
MLAKSKRAIKVQAVEKVQIAQKILLPKKKFYQVEKIALKHNIECLNISRPARDYFNEQNRIENNIKA